MGRKTLGERGRAKINLTFSYKSYTISPLLKTVKMEAKTVPDWKEQQSLNTGALRMMMPGAWRAASSGTMPT